MLNTPSELFSSDTSDLSLRTFAAQARSHQYGSHLKHSHLAQASAGSDVPAPLLTLPAESLTHVTSYLDTKSLFALGLTNRTLHEHVADDNTWRAAFLLQFLGKRPESPNSAGSSPLLRRTEATWKKEFVLRQNLLHRWERSRNGTISHVPHHSTITETHLLSERSFGPALLSASLQYGIVARSLPLSGKVLKGFLTTNDGFGFGIGNPNAEFTPNMTASAIFSQGWSVRVIWGNSSGEVMIASAAKIMDSGRASSKVVRCRVEDQHRGPVAKVAWDKDFVVSAGSDGEVRIWDPKRLRCLWNLRDSENVPTDECICLLPLLEYGVIAVVKASGVVVVWTDIVLSAEAELNVTRPAIRINAPHGVRQQPPTPTHAFLDPRSIKDAVTICLHFDKQLHFYRLDIALRDKSYECTRFGDGPLGPIQTIRPLYASVTEGGEDIIFTGDTLGRVCMFKWSRSDDQEVRSFRCFDVVSDATGGITDLTVNQYVLALGTSRGVVHIFDVLTLKALRELNCAPARGDDALSSVREMILERDLLIIATGDRVVAWKAGPVLSRKQITPSKKSSNKVRNFKWHKRVELAQDISESQRAEADSHTSDQRQYSRQRAQHSALRELGLEEHEAVEYLLMLSREEALAKEEAEQTDMDEGVFAGEMDDVANIHRGELPSAPNMVSRSTSSSSAPSLPFRTMPTPPRSNVKVQVTPPLRPEPMEAGGLSLSSSPFALGSIPHSHSSLSPTESGALESSDDAHFPAISSSVSSTTSDGPRPSGSPPVISGSWTAKLKVSPPAMGSSGSNALASSSRSRSTQFVQALGTPRPSASLLSASLTRAGSSSLTPAEQEEADLKLALELSLAEAMSLEENE